MFLQNCCPISYFSQIFYKLNNDKYLDFCTFVIFQKCIKCVNLRKSEISSGGDDGNGNGHGSGNGRNGAEEQVPIRESVGRGAKRGKPEPMAIYR